MNMPSTIEKINKMRNGEKIKCTKCDNGYVSAIGKPQTAYLFRCNGCGTSMITTRK